MDPVLTPPSHRQHWQARLELASRQATGINPVEISGRITRVTGLVMEAVGLKLPIGSACVIPLPSGARIEAEVVGFNNDHLLLMPQNDVEGVVPGAAVLPLENPAVGQSAGSPPRRRAIDRTRHLPAGDALLGRVLDGAGRPLDGLGALPVMDSAPLAVRATNPLSRAPITQVLDVGILAINTLLTVGRGQRMGLFAGSGVGKSVLLGMMARYTSADIIVVGLIGERGREVKEFIEENLGEEGRRRSVVVAAPADASALLRLQGAAYATALAEYFRDRGKHVLLIMDSLTRYAMAQREIALAIGEPPATKGYPPSVFARLPTLVERAGNGRPDGGSITAFYTVLTEGDDQQDPIADAARAILDGHIVLNRRLAEAGHYPAIDIEQSISRVMHNITGDMQQQQARRLKQLLGAWSRNRDLVNVGAYVSGSDPLVDEALARMPAINRFLQQGIREQAGIQESLGELSALFS